MPINREKFEDTNPEDLEGECSPGSILAFLAENNDKAFKPLEIADQTGCSFDGITSILLEFKRRNLVQSKGTYWIIINDSERLEAFKRYHLTTETLNEMYGEEDPEEWALHAANFDE